MKRQLLIVGMLLMSLMSFSQVVEKALFERAVDYINCQITEVSLTDQIGQAHLPAFKAAIKNKECSFEPLVVFLKTRPTGVMTQNLELSYFINSYKEKYNSELGNEALYTILKIELFQAAEIQNFKLKHPESFIDFENKINDYLINLLEIKQKVTETISKDDWGDIVMVEDEKTTSTTPTRTTSVTPTRTTPTVRTQEEQRPSLITPETKRNFSPFNYGDGVAVFSLSSWMFRISLLIASLAVLLYVLLPYYEKREKAKVKKPGNEVHPKALGLEAEVAILENKNRILRQKIEKMHLDLNDYEDTFRSL